MACGSNCFQREYNDRLYSGLVVLTLTMAVLCRSALKHMVLEFVCWASFLFLEMRSTQYNTHLTQSKAHTWQTRKYDEQQR
jgi:fatty-acid desaturase